MTSCELDFGACTEELRPGVAVEIRERATGNAAAIGATLVAFEGTFADSVKLTPQSAQDSALYKADPTLTIAHERPGTYVIVVRKPGFRDWVAQNVRVNKTSDGCHVETVELNALLDRQP